MDRAGAGAEVSSAGFGPAGLAAVDEAVTVMMEVGIDLHLHRSRLVNVDVLRASDLIVVMTRQHAIDVVLLDVGAWPRTFTIADLVRRGRQIGPIDGAETMRRWAARAHGGRQRTDLLALPASDDIADPVGQPLTRFRHTRDTLNELTEALAALITSGTGCASSR